MVMKILIGCICFCACAGAFADSRAEPKPISVFDSGIYRELFATEAMRSVFNDRAMVGQWLSIEIALAEVQASVGVIPKSAAKAIEDAAKIENIDFDKLRKSTNKVGRGIKPLLSQIKEHGNKEVAEYLHWGSTTQDIMDTVTVLQIKAGSDLIWSQFV